MKKFRFSLETVLDYKQQLFDRGSILLGVHHLGTFFLLLFLQLPEDLISFFNLPLPRPEVLLVLQRIQDTDALRLPPVKLLAKVAVRV